MKKNNIAQGYLYLLLAILIFIYISCTSNQPFTITGTVQSTETGKDGYTASLISDNGESFDAVFSKVKIGKDYRVYSPGERVQLTGDTTHMENKLRIAVNEIKK